MTELDIDVSIGPVRQIFSPGALVKTEIITGPCRLMGWSYGDLLFTDVAYASGKASAPLAGGVVADAGNQGGELPDIAWNVSISGTPAAADANNFGLYVGGTLVAESINPGAVGNYPQVDVTDAIGFFEDIQVRAIGAATAGTVYAAEISVTPANRGQTAYILEDGGNQVAVIASGPDRYDTRWFGPHGIHVNGALTIRPNPGFGTGTFYVAFYRELP